MPENNAIKLKPNTAMFGAKLSMINIVLFASAGIALFIIDNIAIKTIATFLLISELHFKALYEKERQALVLAHLKTIF